MGESQPLSAAAPPSADAGRRFGLPPLDASDVLLFRELGARTS
jgi:hypothetical protein